MFENNDEIKMTLQMAKWCLKTVIAQIKGFASRLSIQRMSLTVIKMTFIVTVSSSSHHDVAKDEPATQRSIKYFGSNLMETTYTTEAAS